MKQLFRLAFSFVTVLLLISSCKEKKVVEEVYDDELGSLSIEVSGAEEAVAYFEDGLLMMHSFEYEDSAEAFRKAQSLDNTFAMAYWGEAMTHYHAIWKQLDKVKGAEILEKLGATTEERMAMVPTAFEKDLFQGAEILFGEGSKDEKDIAYRDYMESLFVKYPEHHEIGSLYALSILGAVKGGRNYEEYNKGAIIAQSIIDENPNHPGALHYLIHSYDDPDNAPKALAAADSYAKVAPDAGHALHMPSHIYVSMGMWDQVVSSNQESWQASVNRKERKNLDNDALGYHAYKWLLYGHLQRGEEEIARSIVQKMQKYCSELPSNRAKSHLIAMKGAYFTETGKWDDELVQDTFDYEDINLQSRSVSYFITAVAALNNKDIKTAQDQVERLNSAIYEAGNKSLAAEGSSTCSGNYGNGTASQNELNRAKVVRLEIEAMIALEEGQEDQAEKLFKEAVELEESTSFAYGPPAIVKPSNEMYGDWLMKKNRVEEAKVQYEKVLERSPKRLLAITGLEKINTNKT